MRDRRLNDAIGLCMKAGRCRSGDFTVEKLARAGEARLVLLDAQISAATRERYERLCSREQIPLVDDSGAWRSNRQTGTDGCGGHRSGICQYDTTCGGGCANAGRAYVQNKRSGA